MKFIFPQNYNFKNKFLFIIVGFNHENIIYIFIYLIKYLKSNKLYFYHKI